MSLALLQLSVNLSPSTCALHLPHQGNLWWHITLVQKDDAGAEQEIQMLRYKIVYPCFATYVILA